MAARRIERLAERQENERLAAGTHFRDHEGRLIPVGYRWAGDERTAGGVRRTDPEPSEAGDEAFPAGQNPRDSAENEEPGPRIRGL